MYTRYLKLNLPLKQSAFLWGARKTGKSTFLRTLYPNSIIIDMLDTHLEMRYTKSPWEFRQDILHLKVADLNYPIIVDEVQKVPSIMDEIHWLIENTKASFILCGSSARKMRQAGVNLLGGRAIRYEFFPLVYPEIRQDFNLLKIFNHGLIPSHYIAPEAKLLLESYIYEYLSSEIKAEGIVRNLATFNRFLDSVTFSHGEMLNYTNI
ncbi:MAG: AAA family ATPase, partial [Bacteroidetes bacterium]|nr:AAA family ATPase [Bacteroidota bacterium]